MVAVFIIYIPVFSWSLADPDAVSAAKLIWNTDWKETDGTARDSADLSLTESEDADDVFGGCGCGLAGNGL